MRDESQPSYGQVWEYQGQEVFILGNSPNDDGKTVWAASRSTGLRCDAIIKNLTATPITGSNTFDELTEKCATWARAGNADAAWWLGWRFDGENQPKSMWYQLAAIRIKPRSYAWLLENLESNCKYGVMCHGVSYPDISFMKQVPEFNDRQISKDWDKAIANAEIAAHVPQSNAQIESAICALSKGIDYESKAWKEGLPRLETAAWEAGLTCQGLTQSAQYKQWANGWCNGSGKDVNYGRPVSPDEIVGCRMCGRFVTPESLFADFSKPTFERHKRS